MNKQEIKKLAHLVAEQETVNSTVKKYIFEEMKKSDLKIFLTYLKNEVRKTTVFVATPIALDASSILNIKKMYGAKRVENTLDPELGSGLVISHKDDIIDMSLKGFVKGLVKIVS